MIPHMWGSRGVQWRPPGSPQVGWGWEEVQRGFAHSPRPSPGLAGAGGTSPSEEPGPALTTAALPSADWGLGPHDAGPANRA